jgi:hypothetical protein
VNICSVQNWKSGVDKFLELSGEYYIITDSTDYTWILLR